MSEIELSEHLEELAWLLGQYDDSDDIDVLWPDIEARATSTLQMKIAEKRKQDTYRFLVNPVRTLVPESLDKLFWESVDRFRDDRYKEEKAKMQAGSQEEEVGPPKVGLKQFLMAKLGISPQDAEASPVRKKIQAARKRSFANKSPRQRGDDLKKSPVSALQRDEAKMQAESSKTRKNQISKRPRGKTLKKPPSFKDDSEEEESTEDDEPFRGELIVPQKLRRGKVLKKKGTHSAFPNNSPRDDSASPIAKRRSQAQGADYFSEDESRSEEEDTEEELSEEEDDDEAEATEVHVSSGSSFNLLDLPPAPDNLPNIFCELSLMLAEAPVSINWDALAQRASPELRDLIIEKKSRDETAFRNSPYNQLVPLRVYDAFQWYRMELQKAMAQPLAPLTAQIEDRYSSRNLSSGKNYDIVFDKSTLMLDPTKDHGNIAMKETSVTMAAHAPKAMSTPTSVPTKAAFSTIDEPLTANPLAKTVRSDTEPVQMMASSTTVPLSTRVSATAISKKEAAAMINHDGTKSLLNSPIQNVAQDQKAAPQTNNAPTKLSAAEFIQKKIAATSPTAPNLLVTEIVEKKLATVNPTTTKPSAAEDVKKKLATTSPPTPIKSPNAVSVHKFTQEKASSKFVLLQKKVGSTDYQAKKTPTAKSTQKKPVTTSRSGTKAQPGVLVRISASTVQLGNDGKKLEACEMVAPIGKYAVSAASDEIAISAPPTSEKAASAAAGDKLPLITQATRKALLITSSTKSPTTQPASKMPPGMTEEKTATTTQRTKAILPLPSIQPQLSMKPKGTPPEIQKAPTSTMPVKVADKSSEKAPLAKSSTGSYHAPRHKNATESVLPVCPPVCTENSSQDEKKEVNKDDKDKGFKQKMKEPIVYAGDDGYDDVDDDEIEEEEDDDEYRASDDDDDGEDGEGLEEENSNDGGSVSDKPESSQNEEKEMKEIKDIQTRVSNARRPPENKHQTKIINEAYDDDHEKDKQPLAVLTPELFELAELLGKQKHPFDWDGIEKAASKRLKAFFAAKRKKFEHFDRNRGGYLIRTQQRANFRRLRRQVIKRLKGTLLKSRNETLKTFHQQKRVSAMKRISGLANVDESSLTEEQRELARVLALQESDKDINWDLVKAKASPALNRLIEAEELHEDFGKDPLRFLVGIAKYNTFKKLTSSLSKGGPTTAPIIPNVPGLEQWTPVQREFALILAEIRVSGKERLAGNRAHDWQYIFKAASPALRSTLDEKSQEHPTFFRAPARFLVSHNDDDVAKFLDLRKLFEKALANDKDRLIEKAKSFAPKIKKGPRMSDEEIEKALEDIENMPRMFVEFAEILEDIKEQHTDHHYDTVYDWDYINSVASRTLRKHLSEKRSYKCFERSKMNTIIGRDRHRPFKLLRLKIRRFRNQDARRTPRGHGLTRSWEHARFENEDDSGGPAKMVNPEAETIPDLEPFLPDVTTLIEPEIQLARVLEEIKFLRPNDKAATIWDMDYIFSHGPGRLTRHIERKMRLNENWSKHKLRTFVKKERSWEFKKMRLLIRDLLNDARIKPLPHQKGEDAILRTPTPTAKASKQSVTSKQSGGSDDDLSDRKRPAKEILDRKDSVDDNNDSEVSSEDDNTKSELEDDSDQSYTDEEEMVTLKNSSRGIKLTSSLKELAIFWELFNNHGQDPQPDWDQVEKHVSPSLRRLIREKRLHNRIFNDDPSLLLVFPDLRANFDRFRAEVRRDPDFYTAHIPRAAKAKARLERKRLKKRKRALQVEGRQEVTPAKARKFIGDHDADNDYHGDVSVAASQTSSKKGGKRRLESESQSASKSRKIVVDNDDDENNDSSHGKAIMSLNSNDGYTKTSQEKLVMFITRNQMRELAQLMVRARKRKEGWTFVEGRASSGLRFLMQTAASKHPDDYFDSPTRCLVPTHLWADFTKLREAASQKSYKGDEDSDNDFEERERRRKKNQVSYKMAEQQRELLSAFSKKMREQLMEFEASQHALLTELEDEDD